MGLDPVHFVIYVIRPVLLALTWHSPAAERLVLGTGVVESRLKYLHQIGCGPALGPYQMEPATASDIWQNFLAFDKQAAWTMRGLRATGLDPATNLEGNLFYATGMCRAQYRRFSDPLPAANDAAGMAAYHKKHYNTARGDTDTKQSVKHFAAAIKLCDSLT